MFDIAKWFRKPRAGRRPIPGVEARSDSVAEALKRDLQRIWSREFGSNPPPSSVIPPRPPPPPAPPPPRRPSMSARILVPRMEWDDMESRESTITINRTVSNGNVSVTNGEIWINGQRVECSHAKNITIEITGNVSNLEVDACNSVSVHGNVGTMRTGSADVTVTGDVACDVQTGSGEVEVGGNIGGNVTTGSGDVRANTINGGVRTASGDISGGGIRHVQY